MPQLIDAAACHWDDFPARAQAVTDWLRMTVTHKIDGLDERIWTARLGEAQFCISWDTWSDELSIMTWESTPDSEVQRLLKRAASA